jgi:hypothetical protein
MAGLVSPSVGSRGVHEIARFWTVRLKCDGETGEGCGAAGPGRTAAKDPSTSAPVRHPAHCRNSGRSPSATKQQAAGHDRKTTKLARYKLGRITADDADGYHRVACPAAMGKIRCPLRPASMLLDWDRPKILAPPGKPARLLRPADHHRPGGRGSQGQAETRLPVKSPPPVLHPMPRAFDV